MKKRLDWEKVTPAVKIGRTEPKAAAATFQLLSLNFFFLLRVSIWTFLRFLIFAGHKNSHVSIILSSRQNGRMFIFPTNINGGQTMVNDLIKILKSFLKPRRFLSIKAKNWAFDLFYRARSIGNNSNFSLLFPVFSKPGNFSLFRPVIFQLVGSLSIIVERMIRRRRSLVPKGFQEHENYRPFFFSMDAFLCKREES